MAIVGDVKRMSIPLSSSPRSKYRKWFLVHRLNGCFQRHAVLLCFVMFCRWWSGMDPNLYSKLCMHSPAIWVFIRVPVWVPKSHWHCIHDCVHMAMWHVISQHSQHFDHRKYLESSYGYPIKTDKSCWKIIRCISPWFTGAPHGEADEMLRSVSRAQLRVDPCSWTWRCWMGKYGNMFDEWWMFMDVWYGGFLK